MTSDNAWFPPLKAEYGPIFKGLIRDGRIQASLEWTLGVSGCGENNYPEELEMLDEFRRTVQTTLFAVAPFVWDEPGLGLRVSVEAFGTSTEIKFDDLRARLSTPTGRRVKLAGACRSTSGDKDDPTEDTGWIPWDEDAKIGTWLWSLTMRADAASDVHLHDFYRKWLGWEGLWAIQQGLEQIPDRPYPHSLADLQLQGDRASRVMQTVEEILADAELLVRGPCLRCRGAMWLAKPRSAKGGRPASREKTCPLCIAQIEAEQNRQRQHKHSVSKRRKANGKPSR